MTKTKQAILREFNYQFGFTAPNGKTCLALDQDNLNTFLSQALDELAGELVGVVPEKGTSVGVRIGAGEAIETAFEEATKSKGWNSARSALLARCKELGLEVK